MPNVSRTAPCGHKRQAETGTDMTDKHFESFQQLPNILTIAKFHYVSQLIPYLWSYRQKHTRVVVYHVCNCILLSCSDTHIIPNVFTYITHCCNITGPAEVYCGDVSDRKSDEAYNFVLVG